MMTMMKQAALAAAFVALILPSSLAFFSSTSSRSKTTGDPTTTTSYAALFAALNNNNNDDLLLLSTRRGFFGQSSSVISSIAAAAGAAGLLPAAPAANAQVFMDPAQYGDQELRVGAVDSVRESVRRTILQNPQLAPSFYQLAILDGLSYNAQTQEYGPDGSILKLVFSAKANDPYIQNLQAAGLALIEAEKNLRRKNAVSLPDAIAIAGAEAIESIGGPVLTVQLGRADTPKNGRVNSNLPLDLLSGKYPAAQVLEQFQAAGLTEREMTALLLGLMTLNVVEKTRTAQDWKLAARPKFREAGKLGRMSEFKPITEDDIAQAELEADPDYEDPDAGWYIADSFGTRETRFGDRLGKDDGITEKTFNKYIQQLYNVQQAAKKKKGAATAAAEGDEDLSVYGWIGEALLDPNLNTAQTWMSKYAGSNLAYVKDLGIAFNAITQLGAVYTGGKYESLLKNKPRKSLNDDELNLGF